MEIILVESFSDLYDMNSKAHTCPECGEELPLKTYLTLPGDYSIECPHCKTQLKPVLNDFHKIVPWILFSLILITAMKQRSGLTGFLVLVGVLTLVTYLVLLAGAYYFLRFRKRDESEM